MAFSRIIENATKAKNCNESSFFSLCDRYPERNLINFRSRTIYKQLKYEIYIKNSVNQTIKFISKRAFFDNVLTTCVWKNSWVTPSTNQAQHCRVLHDISRQNATAHNFIPLICFTSTFFLICFLFVSFVSFFLLLIWQTTFLLQQLGESIVLYSRFMESTRCYNAVNVFENCQWIWSNLQSQCYNYKNGLKSMCSTSKSKIPTFFLVPTRCAWSLFKSVFTTQISISTVSDFKKISSFSLNKDILSSLSKSPCSLQSNGFNSVSETDFSSSERYVDNQNRTFQNKGHVTKN